MSVISLPEIEVTDDGTQTLRHHVYGETYHSRRGAVGESQHVFVNAGMDYVIDRGVAHDRPLKILEVGFGSGLNAYLTAKRAGERKVAVEYRALELYPVEVSLAAELEYASDPLFMEMHSTAWGEIAAVTEYFSLEKLNIDFCEMEGNGTFDLVYFDAFAPDIQPELWSTQQFAKLYESMRKGGVLVTYSAKGEVKRNLREAGFDVTRLPGALGKRHMLRAINK